MQFVCILFHICRKFEVLISQGGNMPKVGWVCHTGFITHFIRFPAVQKFWKSVKIWQSYGQLKGGKFFETQCIFRRTQGCSTIEQSELDVFLWIFLQAQHWHATQPLGVVMKVKGVNQSVCLTQRRPWDRIQTTWASCDYTRQHFVLRGQRTVGVDNRSCFQRRHRGPAGQQHWPQLPGWSTSLWRSTVRPPTRGRFPHYTLCYLLIASWCNHSRKQWS